MKRPSYRDAVDWLAQNDDNTEWPESIDLPTVAASLVRDIFDVTDEKLAADIKRRIKKLFGRK